MCTLVCDGRIFIAKRGFGLADAEGCWSTVNGFIDENKPVAEIAAQEFLEETGIFIKPSQIKVGKAYTLKSTNNKRSYIVFPCLAVVARMPKIQLDREHTDFQWIKRSELENFHILDDLPVAVDAALKLL